MRIVLFTETFIPKVDGIVTTLCQTIKQLKSLGHEVLIFAPEGGFSEYEQCRIVGIRGHAFPFYPELRLSFPRASMRQTITEFKPDLIHVTEPALLGIAGLYYAGGNNGGALRLPLTVSYHTDLPNYLRYYGLGFLEPYIWPLLRLRHNRATVNLCTSEIMVRQLEEHGIARVALWPGGVDSDRFHPSRRSDPMRARLTNGHPESPLLLYVGRLSAEKDIELLKPVLQAIPEARVALVGDGPHRKALEQHFAGLPVFMAGFLHGNELAGAYASSDIFVMPSRTETLGLVVLEAMCSGLPVVAARAGGIPEMIEDGASGYLFDDQSQAIAAIRQLLPSHQKREAMGAVARTHAAEHSWKAATAVLVEHFQTACLTQQIAPNPSPPPIGLRAKLRKTLSRSILFLIRKLLP
ncbi:MAG: glycosyltransferase family 1 protein [Terracidiphilus sp.]